MPKVRHTSTVTDKPFTCSKGCESAFSRPSDLARHEKSHLPPQQREYKCNTRGCYFTANQRNGLVCHIRSVHEKKRVYCKYPGCTSNFSDPSCLSRHRRQHWPAETTIQQTNDTEELKEPSKCRSSSTLGTSEKALPRAEVESPDPNISNESTTLHTQSPDLQRRTIPSSANSRPAVLFSAPASRRMPERFSCSHLGMPLDRPCPARKDRYNDIFVPVHPPIQAPIGFNFETLPVPGPSSTSTAHRYRTNFDASFDPHPTIPISLPQPYDGLDSVGGLTEDFSFASDPLLEFTFDGLQFPSNFDLIPPLPETFIWPGFSSADATFPDIPTASSLASTPNFDFDFGCVDPWPTMTQTPWDITTPSLNWS